MKMEKHLRDDTLWSPQKDYADLYAPLAAFRYYRIATRALSQAFKE